MKGSKCRCGYANTSYTRICPRCGKPMKASEWPDEGKVLSFARLQAIPEGLKDRYNLALVAIENGPKLICWTSDTLEENDEVTIVEQKGNTFCTTKGKPMSELKESVKA